MATSSAATLEWVHWYNEKRLNGALGYMSPAQTERNFHHSNFATKIAAE
jgi:transposase InsO family protein